MRVLGFTVLLFAILYINTAESKATLEQAKGMMSKLKGKCQKDTGVSDALIEGTHSGQFPADQSLGCYEACVLQTMNLVKDNKISESALSKTVNTMFESDVVTKMTPMVSTCIAAAKGADLCEQSLNFVKCWYDMDSSLYLFP